MTRGIKLLFLTVFTVSFANLLNSGVVAQDDGTQRTTLNGIVQGRIQVSRNGREFYSFEGIPYAKPPARFLPPEYPENWESIRDATVPGEVCAQIDNNLHKGSEDCLFLNVFMPKVESGNDTDLLPVMVWIHGGEFRSRSGSEMGPKYFMDEDVILVTINYRLGVFGFLNTGDDVVTGNMGLKDMIKALQWVQANIEVFGGDRNYVTIFGVSAGGAAVHSLMISPAAKGLFHQVIAGSGTALNPWAVSTNTSGVNQIFFENVGCQNATTTAETVECLRGKSVGDLLDAVPAIDVPFTPSVDSQALDPVLPDAPQKLLESGDNNAGVNLIVGFSEQEWLAKALGALRNEETLRNLNENWPDTINVLMKLRPALAPGRDLAEVANRSRELYFSQAPITSENWAELTSLLSDFDFVWGAKRAAILHASERGAAVFPYIFTYVGNFSLVDTNDDPSHGPTHADELQYLFQSLLTPQPNWPDFEPGSRDDEFSKNLVAMWASFAKTGAPVSWAGAWEPVDANAFGNDENPFLTWLNIGEEPAEEREKSVVQERMGFWNEVLLKSFSMPSAGIPSCILLFLSSVSLLMRM